MKNIFILMVCLILFLNCSSNQNNRKQELQNLFSHTYSVEEQGLTSLSFQVKGNHDVLDNFLTNISVDSPQIYIYWKAPFNLKTVVKTQTGICVELPRWLDFGFAFGILYGPDLHPILRKAENEFLLLEKEFQFDRAATIEEEQFENHTRKLILKSNDQLKATQTILLDRDNFPLSRNGSRLVNRNHKIVDLQFSENWLRLPEDRLVVSHYEKYFNDQTQLKIQKSVRYFQINNFWLPVEIIEKQSANEKGRVYRMVGILLYENHEINPALPDSLFQFKKASEVVLDLSSPRSALNSFIRTIQSGNDSLIHECFSIEMKKSFETLSGEIYRQLTPYPLIPVATMYRIQTDVLQWVYSNYLIPSGTWEITVSRQETTTAEANVNFQQRVALFSGPYRLVQENTRWKIDTNPYVIFRDVEKQT